MNLIRSINILSGRGLLLKPRLLYFTSLQRTQSTVIAPPTRNPIRKTIRYFKNDPFARVSIMFGGTVLVVLLIIEAMIPKRHKKIKPQIGVLPPQVSHPTVPRSSHLSSLLSFLPSKIFSLSPSVVVVTGPPGSGKTELIRQFVSKFIEVSSPKISKKESLKPIVLYIDCNRGAHSSDDFHHVANILGITLRIDTPPLELILNKLGEQKAKWLLVLDGYNFDNKKFSSEVRSFFEENIISNRKLRKGYILIASEEEEGLEGMTNKYISLKNGLSHSEASDLFHKLASKSFPAPTITTTNQQPLNELLSNLNYSPLLVSLAGLTVHLFQSTDLNAAINDYQNVVAETSHDCQNKTQKITEIFIEKLRERDNYFLHAIDFLSLCDLEQPIPTSLIKGHLKNNFFRLPSSTESVVFEDAPTASPLDTPSLSYFAMIKEKIPLFGGGASQQLQTPPTQQLESGRGTIHSLCHSPFVHTYTRNGVELITVRPLVDFSKYFINYTVSKMEHEQVFMERQRWNESALFKRFRNFDEKSVLEKFRRSLPGLEKGSQICTEKAWLAKEVKPHPSLSSYSNYIHYLSHNHRYVKSLIDELKYLSRDPDHLALRRYIKPHLLSISSTKRDADLLLLTNRDKLMCEIGLLKIDSCLHHSTNNKDIYYERYSRLLDKIKDTFGSLHTEIANVYTSMAELQYYNRRYNEAKDLLVSALDVHERSNRSSPSFEENMNLACTLSTLGLVYASMEEREKCLSTLERALGLFQIIPSNGDIPNKQRRLVATTVTDLGHAYLYKGDLISARRYLDLALVAQRGIHGDDHPEVARVLNVLSIVYSLTGNNEESKEKRREAGKIQDGLKVLSNTL